MTTNQLEIALSTDGQFTYVCYGTLTACFLTSRFNAGLPEQLYTIQRHEDPMMARLVFEWATRSV